MLESSFSPASSFCPNPELWHAHDGMATEVEVLELVAAFVRATQPNLVIETGTHRGFGAEAIGYALHLNGHGRLVTIEMDPALVVEARDRVEGLPVTVVEGSSLEFVPSSPVDFAWFDSDTDIRVAEFRAFRPFMHDRTVVGFHDTHPRHLYRPQLDSLGIQLLDLPTPRGVTFGRVR